ncbi:hypothetical protein [Hahella ganghwensis]|uniref:hypothetical protein n=1 Tax=Hahella ganghwensis TaxID=286420 RepID=UPI00038267E6|nr:hypothetical protein [Hahella ganghwensis]
MNISIASSSVVTALGPGTAVNAAAVQAGISMVRESTYLSSKKSPIRMATLLDDCLPTLDKEISRQPSGRYRRMLQLLQLALEELELGINTDLGMPVFINLPDNLGLSPQGLQTLQEVQRLSGININWLDSRLYLLGRAGGYRALADAWGLLEAGHARQALVIGVDSCRCPRALAHWEKDGRLLLPHTNDGFFPGEGAGCLLLVANDEASTVKLGKPQVSRESAHFYSEEVCLGKGLTEAFHEACHFIHDPVREVICGLNGESAPIKEWGFAVSRLSDNQMADSAGIMHPADCYGDIGAATVPVLLALTNALLEEDHIKGPVLTWCASDYETRGAAVMYKSESQGNLQHLNVCNNEPRSEMK